MNESNKCCDCLDKLNDLYSSVNPATPVVVPITKIYGEEGTFGFMDVINGVLTYFKNIDNTITFSFSGVIDLSTNSKLVQNGGTAPCSNYPNAFSYLIIDNIPNLSYQFRTASFTQVQNSLNPLQTDITYTNVLRGTGTVGNADAYIVAIDENGIQLYNGKQENYLNINTSAYPFTPKSPAIINGLIRFDFLKDILGTPNPNNSFGCSGLVNINISGTT